MFDVEPRDETGGYCDCCGNQSRRVSGFVHENGGYVGWYFLQWTVGKSIEDHPAHFDLIYGPWGEATTQADRCAISLVHFTRGGVPAVSVIDAGDRPFAASGLIGSALSRDQLVGSPLAQRVYAILDAVIVQDGRLR